MEWPVDAGVGAVHWGGSAAQSTKAGALGCSASVVGPGGCSLGCSADAPWEGRLRRPVWLRGGHGDELRRRGGRGGELRQVHDEISRC